jgi:hypothetical protein
MRCGFSSGGNLQWVDLFYDETDLQNQVPLLSSYLTALLTPPLIFLS